MEQTKLHFDKPDLHNHEWIVEGQEIGLHEVYLADFYDIPVNYVAKFVDYIFDGQLEYRDKIYWFSDRALTYLFKQNLAC